MRRIILGLALVLGAPAGAQTLAPLDTGPGVKTCGEFRKLDLAAQVAALATVQPLGDEIDPSDQDAAENWADEVADACGDDADRPLEDAAAAALDQE
ncbi:MAG: hypothetical protein QM699_15090 [Amaricoccus sp.]|uniref:hypothetical protein n=1 Tax=Amaricoccus sp. TaxID=1872485 RepID=UPI0039E39CB7